MRNEHQRQRAHQHCDGPEKRARATQTPGDGSAGGFSPILAGAAILCLSFLGFDAVSTLSEEARLAEVRAAVQVFMPEAASPPSGGASGPNVTQAVEAWGWMLCDGRTLGTHQYPELFAALGYLYGGSDASFRIPDYRGYFWRGTDAGAGVDPDASQRTDPAAQARDFDARFGELQARAARRSADEAQLLARHAPLLRHLFVSYRGEP